MHYQKTGIEPRSSVLVLLLKLKASWKLRSGRLKSFSYNINFYNNKPIVSQVFSGCRCRELLLHNSLAYYVLDEHYDVILPFRSWSLIFLIFRLQKCVKPKGISQKTYFRYPMITLLTAIDILNFHWILEDCRQSA